VQQEVSSSKTEGDVVLRCLETWHRVSENIQRFPEVPIHARMRKAEQKIKTSEHPITS